MIDIPSTEQIIHYFQEQLKHNEFFTGFFWTGLFTAVGYQLRHIPGKIWDWCVRRYTTHVVITSEDRMYNYFHIWLSQQDFSKRNRKFGLLSRRRLKHLDGGVKETIEAIMGDDYGYDDDDDDEYGSAPDVLMSTHQGNYLFRHNGKFIRVHCSISDPVSGATDNKFTLKTITFHYLGTDNKYMEEIIDEARSIYSKLNRAVVSIYIPNLLGNYWDEVSKLTPRHADSVILKDNMKEDIMADVTKFLGRRDWYINLGIPYHRGYLFYGPPGTGKSSTAYVLASEFNKDVYFMSLGSDIKDETFLNLMSRLDDNCILVLEDVDCLFEGRKSEQSLSFSTVLNAIDGFCSSPGTILIMTTNHIEKLDPALIRDGRVDMKIEFGLCTRDQIAALYHKFFPGSEKAAEFAEFFEEGAVSPAEIQGILMRCETEAEVEVALQDYQKAS